MIGYAWDEKNMLVYEGNVNGYQEGDGDYFVGQGIDAAVWYHYFGSAGRSLFTAVGVGIYYFKVEDIDAADGKLGMMLGGGYEFARHFQVALYFSTGKTRMMDLDMTHTNFSIVVDAIAF